MNPCGLFVLFLFVQCALGQAGDQCTLKSGEKGICKPIRECQSAIENLKNKILPVTCGYEGRNPIVCCDSASRVVGDISKAKCKEYAKSVYQEVWTWGGKVTEDVCAFKAGELIVGGEDAKEAEFPHQALLGYGSDDSIVWKCGGSLISETFVLTAAHCRATQEEGEVSVVRLGELDYGLTNDKAEPVDIKVAQFISHPDNQPPQRYNDIALIKLVKSVQFGKYIRPACIHTDFVIPPTRSTSNIPRFIASGFGQTEYLGSVSSKLLKVVLDFFNIDECRKSYKSNSKRLLKDGIVENSQLCAGGRTEEKDTCQGDSGGPLVTYYHEPELYCMYRLVGVTSFGKTCGASGVPGVYTRVSHYVDWIEKNVWS